MPRIEKCSELLKKIEQFETYVRNICKDERASNIVICAGDTGLGKTYRAGKIISEMLKAKKIPAMKILDNTVTSLGLYQTMWQLREGGVILIDDVNNIICDKKNGIPLLKVATDTYAERHVSWNSNDRRIVKVSKYNPKDNLEVFDHYNSLCDSNTKLFALRETGEAVPDMFYFKGAIVIITNKSWESFDKITDGALGCRGKHLEIRTSLNCSIDYLKKMAPSIKESSSLKLDKKTKDAVLKYMTTNKEVLNFYLTKCIKPSLRSFGFMCEDYISEGAKGLTLDNLEANTIKEQY